MGGQRNVKGRENPLTGVIKIGEFNTKKLIRNSLKQINSRNSRKLNKYNRKFGYNYSNNCKHNQNYGHHHYNYQNTITITIFSILYLLIQLY